VAIANDLHFADKLTSPRCLQVASAPRSKREWYDS
jgi:hypothetical protein